MVEIFKAVPMLLVLAPYLKEVLLVVAQAHDCLWYFVITPLSMFDSLVTRDGFEKKSEGQLE